MTDDERARWNDRYREREPPTEPTELLREWIDDLPGSRALDVATGGELYVALAAGVPASACVMHGNNKSVA